MKPFPRGTSIPPPARADQELNDSFTLFGELPSLVRGKVWLPVAPGGGTGTDGMSDQMVDRLVDALEQRVLAEVERRGGRYSGLF